MAGVYRKILDNKGIFSAVLIVLSVFVFFYSFVIPVKLDNMGGTHSWLSGSTIKFVNQWLDEGASNLNFTNYEYPASIEFGNGVSKRIPYLSYPTGETFVVYSIARVFGKQEISISFLHKIQIIFFAIEAVLLTVFVYLFLEKTLKCRSVWIKIIVSSSSGILWMLMPTCAYYLANIFFADQLIILFAMAFILVEYLFLTSNEESGKRRIVLKILRAVLLFFGILVDYYFWILALMAFVLEVISLIVRKRKDKLKGHLFWNTIMWYGVPVVLAITVFILQLSATSGWAEYLKNVFFVRSAGNEKYNLGWQFAELDKNFANAFTLDSAMSTYLKMLLLLVLFAGVWYVVRKKKITKMFTNPGFLVITMNVVAVIVQLLVLKQHSAVHEFSMMKVAWIIALLPLVGAILYKAIFEGALKKVNFLHVYIPCFCIVLLITGVPISTINFIDSHVEVVDYSLEQIIKDNMDYNDVLFSFTKNIEYMPPQSLAISGKPVWKVKNVVDIETKFDDLDVSAKKVLLVEKHVELEKDANKIQSCLAQNGNVRYEDDWVMLVELKDVSKCERSKNDK